MKANAELEPGYICTMQAPGAPCMNSEQSQKYPIPQNCLKREMGCGFTPQLWFLTKGGIFQGGVMPLATLYRQFGKWRALFGQHHRRRMETEAKGKVVASFFFWGGAKFIQFLAALAVLPRSKNFAPQTEATTFAFVSISILLLWSASYRLDFFESD